MCPRPCVGRSLRRRGGGRCAPGRPAEEERGGRGRVCAPRCSAGFARPAPAGLGGVPRALA
eukprot:2442438-Lingulodinium_polyedra.AAC.1